MSEGPKVLTLDIETSPNVADVWRLFGEQRISMAQLHETSRVICWAGKWYGRRPVEFRSEHHDGYEATIRRAHEVLDEADIVIHFNGKRFDVPMLKREFIKLGLNPPSPFRQVDLFQVAKTIGFPSRKLDFVAQDLGIGSKVKHEGHSLWTACLAGDERAWARMRAYNVGDVRLTERVYQRLLPWIGNHPHYGLHSGNEGACPRCGGDRLQRRGFAYTAVGIYQQLHCQSCGSWSRGSKRVGTVDLRAAQ